MASLANKYRPADFDSVIGQGVVVDIVKKMCESGELSNRNFLFTGPAGTGKAQPLYSKVLTPNGFIAMGDVKVGQKIITGSGAIAAVSGVYPQGIKKIYEITLQDRTKIRVAEDHLNVFYRYNQDKKCRQDYCMSTLELIDFMQHSYYKLRMDIPTVPFEHHSVMIDPYLLGVFLGDGSLSGNFAFSNNEEDIIHKVDDILTYNYNMHLNYVDKYYYHIVYNNNPHHCGSRGDRGIHPLVRNYDVLTTLKGQLDYYGLLCKSIDKHIPNEYLINDRETRLKLLQGLFDTDGYISKEGAIEYSTSSKQLSDDFAFLVRSLGIRDTVVAKTPKYAHNGESRVGHTAYRHNLKIPNDLKFYTSEKHTSRYKDRQLAPIRTIVSIEYVGEEECQCIYVDHPDHTYISDGFIPTHNTTLSRIIAKSLNGNTDNIIEVDAASHSGVDDVRELIQEASQFPIGTKYKIIVCDECFPATTPILTASGYKNIADVQTGDIVYSMTGKHNVTHLFKHRVFTNRLCCVKLFDRDIVTTLDHLFFTNNGWVCAKDLCQGDTIYANNVYQNVSSMSKSVSSSEQSQVCEILFDQLRSKISGSSQESRGTLQSSEGNSNMPNLSNFIYYESEQHTKDLLEEVRESACYETVCSLDEYRIWDGKTETVIRTNETKQSDVESGKYWQDVADQGDAWNATSMGRSSGRKWEIHNSADSLIRSIRVWLGVRVPNQYKNIGLENSTITLMLQSRPWLSANETCSRGRWENSSLETNFITRCEENGLFTRVRVEGVEVYQRGSNDELFRGSFSDTELSDDYVTMYDLEVAEDHCYLANGLLVHNCHAFSQTAWQALLKCLEEQTGSTIWVFATTNPEKIPATIISRVQTFKLSKISTENIQKRLKFIVDSEIAEGQQITYDDNALAYIAKISGGGLRDAITLLDKALAFGNNITTELLEKALDLPNYDDYFRLLNALVKKDNAEIMTTIDQVYNSGTNFIKWFEGFHSFLCNIVKYVFLKDISRTTIPYHYSDKLSNYNEQHAFICLKLANLIMSMNKELKTTQYLQETAMTYLCVAINPKK